jgi:hypothetical protein
LHERDRRRPQRRADEEAAGVKLTAESVDELFLLFAAGWSDCQAAREIGVARSTAARYRLRWYEPYDVDDRACRWSLAAILRQARLLAPPEERLDWSDPELPLSEAEIDHAASELEEEEDGMMELRLVPPRHVTDTLLYLWECWGVELDIACDPPRPPVVRVLYPTPWIGKTIRTAWGPSESWLIRLVFSKVRHCRLAHGSFQELGDRGRAVVKAQLSDFFESVEECIESAPRPVDLQVLRDITVEAVRSGQCAFARKAFRGTPGRRPRTQDEDRALAAEVDRIAARYEANGRSGLSPTAFVKRRAVELGCTERAVWKRIRPHRR